MNDLINEIQSKLKLVGGWFDSDIKRPFYLFLAIIVSPLLLLGFQILRSFESVKFFDPLLNNPIDFAFLHYIIMIILGIVIIYKLVNFYFEFDSIQYLLVATFIYGTVVNLYIWNLLYEYFTIHATLLYAGEYEIYCQFAFELGIARSIYWLGPILMLIYVVQLKTWDQYNKFVKSLVLILFIDQLSRVIFDILAFFSMSSNFLSFSDFRVLSGFTGLSYPGTLSRIFIEIENSLLATITEPVYLIYILLVFNLLTSRNLGYSRSMSISKGFWIFFSSSSLIFIILENVLGSYNIHTMTRNVYSIIQMLFMLGLLLILYYGPEVILITDKVLFDAKKIQSVLERAKRSELEIKGQYSQFTNYLPRLKEYVTSIPPEKLNLIIQSKRDIIKAHSD